jgi:4-aminobutyrate aminotransferase/(S)-3-amino-2-methylpropionate transaminase
MVAFDLVKERGGEAPDVEGAKRAVARAAELGLILLSCGVFANAIRILAPLTAADAVVDEGLDRLDAALQA